MLKSDRERERERDDDAVGKMCISSLQHSCKSRHRAVTSVLITEYSSPFISIYLNPSVLNHLCSSKRYIYQSHDREMKLSKIKKIFQF